ncbi:MAG: hypothetical protein H6644_09925 [Caldilineaceae bacterium]|nr:hypothetical protein [Caldilineaceae bacterium]
MSPLVDRTQRSAGSIPIGFEEDSAYLGGAQQAGRCGRWPCRGRSSIDDMATSLRHAALSAARSPALTLISVWTTTFLTLLVSAA